MKHRNSIASSILILALLAQACGGGFASNLRSILAGAGPVIDSLPLSPQLKSGLIQDFKDLGNSAADLKDELDACVDKPCKLEAVNKFQVRFWDIQRRGHFGSYAKLEKIESILKAIIDSARVYFGAPAKRGEQVGNLDTLLKELKREMKPTSQLGFIPCDAPRYAHRPECDSVEIHPCLSSDIAHNAHQVGGRAPVNCK